jgi:hypothetical protein
MARQSTVTIEGFDVSLDLRDQGYRDVIGGSLFTEDNGDLSFRFGHSLISDYCEYIFGFFGHAYQPKLQRMLRVRLKIG